MEQLSPPSLKIQKHRWLHKNLANSWVLQKGMMDWFWELRQKSKWNFEIPPSFQFVESSLELHIARITHWKIAILAVLLMPGVTVNSRHECLSKGRTEGPGGCTARPGPESKRTKKEWKGLISNLYLDYLLKNNVVGNIVLIYLLIN